MIQYISAPFKWFFKLEAASGLILLIAAIIALILSNTNLSDYYFDILNIHFTQLPLEKFLKNMKLLKKSCLKLKIKQLFFRNL